MSKVVSEDRNHSQCDQGTLLDTNKQLNYFVGGLMIHSEWLRPDIQHGDIHSSEDAAVQAG